MSNVDIQNLRTRLIDNFQQTIDLSEEDMAGLLEDINGNFVSSQENDANTANSMYGAALEANQKFFGELTSAMSAIASGDGAPVEIGGVVIDNINTPAGMTVFTTQVQLFQAQLEVVNNTFNFIKQFEKSLGNLIS